jgi:threonine/homoserine/homoserine lactone efflux protein
VTLTVLLRGLVIGFSLAAPVGPIGLLCIRRSLAEGRVVGLVTGLGAATADAAYGTVAAFGLTAVSGFLVAQRLWLGLLGGAFLCCLGVRTFISAPADRAAKTRGDGLLSAYASTFILTLTNPMTIVSFVAIFAGLGVGASSDYLPATALVAGIFLGSALWWVLLSTGVASAGLRLTGGWMRVVDHVSGAMIFTFGLFAIVSAFRR